MSLHIAKFFKNPLALAGAALVIHIGAGTAAGSPGDGKVTSRTADAQESARQLLLGTTGSRVGGAEAIKQSQVAGASGETARQARPVAHGDAQAAARQLLLGQPVASDASRVTARRTR